MERQVASHPVTIQESALRPGHPDFLDLPWHAPVEMWDGLSERIVRRPSGPSRHPVVFADYGGRVYAFKQSSRDAVVREYERLRSLEALRLPVVTPVGYMHVRTPVHEAAVLITRYLDYALPYHHLFMQPDLERYREHLLDALAGLLVQLHIAGVYWGDCSLSNTLFRRDAGALQAYLVDAETAEAHPHLAPGLREHDLEIMEENVYGALLDLTAMGALPPGYAVDRVGAEIRRRYGRLWGEITREEVLSPHERYRIQERIRALNALGFSVEEVELTSVAAGDRLRLRVFVADRNFHRDLLVRLTGVEAEEAQARQMMGEIQELKATLSREENRSLPLSLAAQRWLAEIYHPIAARLRTLAGDGTPLPELYCQLLEHKWYLSEAAGRDVGHAAALDDYARRLTAK
ncbi:MAG: DUF4032 domain-containing protein [Armatimonadota bacterium]|nr:DUF4032 domain-containing protein [Armatimonadota bacterium]MDR7450777.1 DUF4032 domain-containing protein [Armatimonadota bacterium]MDR7493830.1 DUF4032 domain-containing protein [Armatimonadota bacterium]MDR7499009.1 DUF4032 domain-containing protein [Armatimonadota bacterium]MDR7504795.1 DUF4032 domain-containing protein [Armatimonadota bacterium]